MVPVGRHLGINLLGFKFPVDLGRLDVSISFYFNSHVIFYFFASGVILIHKFVYLSNRVVRIAS